MGIRYPVSYTGYGSVMQAKLGWRDPAIWQIKVCPSPHMIADSATIRMRLARGERSAKRKKNSEGKIVGGVAWKFDKIRIHAEITTHCQTEPFNPILSPANQIYQSPTDSFRKRAPVAQVSPRDRPPLSSFCIFDSDLIDRSNRSLDRLLADDAASCIAS